MRAVLEKKWSVSAEMRVIWWLLILRMYRAHVTPVMPFPMMTIFIFLWFFSVLTWRRIQCVFTWFWLETHSRVSLLGSGVETLQCNLSTGVVVLICYDLLWDKAYLVLTRVLCCETRLPLSLLLQVRDLGIIICVYAWIFFDAFFIFFGADCFWLRFLGLVLLFVLMVACLFGQIHCLWADTWVCPYNGYGQIYGFCSYNATIPLPSGLFWMVGGFFGLFFCEG